jgi:hypothetical protein
LDFDAAAKSFENISPSDKHFMRGEFGDILKAVDPQFVKTARFEFAALLWHQAHKSGSEATRNAPEMSPYLQGLAEEACKSSFVNRLPAAH